MFFYRAPSWSPVELEYLKTHQNDPQGQLSIALGKSTNAVKNKLWELEHGYPKPSAKRSGKGTKIGKRVDLGIFLRSGWEADFMRYLKHEKFEDSEIEYEPQTFTYTQFGIKHGTIHYVPDFKVQNFKKNGEYSWVEVKGFLKAEDKVKLRRFKKYYPEEFAKLVIVCGSEKTATYKFCKELGVKKIIVFNDLRKKYKDKIPNWES
jgi:hypothetical protein